MRRGAFCVLSLALGVFSAGAAWAYVPPVVGEITDPFRPPATKYSSGNRGIDYSPSAGTTVVASAAGQVTFAGHVGGDLFVVIAHDDGIRTTYGYLASIGVRVGQHVERGSAVGTSGATLHFGARIGDRYIDPSRLFGSKVHLVPLRGLD